MFTCLQLYKVFDVVSAVVLLANMPTGCVQALDEMAHRSYVLIMTSQFSLVIVIVSLSLSFNLLLYDFNWCTDVSSLFCYRHY